MLHLIRLFSFVVLSRVCHAQCTLTPYAHTVLTWLWRWLPHRLIVKTSITVNNSPIQEVLSSLGRSYSTCLWIDSWVQTFHSVCVLFISQENHTGCVLKHVKNQEIQKHTFWTFELFVVETILPLIKIIVYTVHGVQKMFWFHLTTFLDFLKKHHVIIVKLFIFFLWGSVMAVSNYCKVPLILVKFILKALLILNRLSHSLS